MSWSSPYIPDLTERFPEGFGGVDLTDSFYPSVGNLRNPDPWQAWELEASKKGYEPSYEELAEMGEV